MRLCNVFAKRLCIFAENNIKAIMTYEDLVNNNPWVEVADMYEADDNESLFSSRKQYVCKDDSMSLRCIMRSVKKKMPNLIKSSRTYLRNLGGEIH